MKHISCVRPMRQITASEPEESLPGSIYYCRPQTISPETSSHHPVIKVWIVPSTAGILLGWAWSQYLHVVISGVQHANWYKLQQALTPECLPLTCLKLINNLVKKQRHVEEGRSTNLQEYNATNQQPRPNQERVTPKIFNTLSKTLFKMVK